MYSEFDRAGLSIGTLPSYHPRVSSLSKGGIPVLCSLLSQPFSLQIGVCRFS